jgi:hypothetical protein
VAQPEASATAAKQAQAALLHPLEDALVIALMSVCRR